MSKGNELQTNTENTQSGLTSENFDFGTASNTGGVTGSKRVQGDDGNLYQYKFSQDPSELPLVRKVANYRNKRDEANYGEVIAACASNAIMNALQQSEQAPPKLMPDVSLVYDETRGKVDVASKYLASAPIGLQKTNPQTLDEYATKDQGVVPEGKHVHISAKQDNTGPGILNIAGEKNKQLRNDLCRNIAISALAGDHDVNPGNMITLHDDQGNVRMARIDLGHAFNHLIRGNSFGGGLKNKQNAVMDFLNRKEVLGITNNGSKLWRDYSGLVPSEELANAFEEVAKAAKDNVQVGLDDAKKQFEQIIRNAEDKPELLEHIKKSLEPVHDL